MKTYLEYQKEFLKTVNIKVGDVLNLSPLYNVPDIIKAWLKVCMWGPSMKELCENGEEVTVDEISDKGIAVNSTTGIWYYPICAFEIYHNREADIDATKSIIISYRGTKYFTKIVRTATKHYLLIDDNKVYTKQFKYKTIKSINDALPRGYKFVEQC